MSEAAGEGAVEVVTAGASLIPAPADDADVLAMLLADKRSENTRRAYRHDARMFFLAAYGAEPSPDLVRLFLALDTAPMAAQLLRYKAALIAEGKAEATINRRMAAVLSLVRFARRVGATVADPADRIDAERVRPYRDTRGISAEQARRLLRTPDRETIPGQRDYALLLLLLENALRRAEIAALRVGDFDPAARTLRVKGKGRGTQAEPVTLSSSGCAALLEYLNAEGRGCDSALPLFVNYSPAARGRALTANGVYKIVRALAARAEISGALSPHRLRHMAITLALDAAGGDIRRVQRLSRHARLETLQIYDDNRQDLQGEVTALLSEILRADAPQT